jgi:hypothetical protein
MIDERSTTICDIPAGSRQLTVRSTICPSDRAHVQNLPIDFNDLSWPGKLS